MECIHVLLSGYVDDPSRVPTYDRYRLCNSADLRHPAVFCIKCIFLFLRRRFTTVCLDNICGYLVELQSLSPSSALEEIIRNFKSLQAKLEKLHWGILGGVLYYIMIYAQTSLTAVPATCLLVLLALPSNTSETEGTFNSMRIKSHGEDADAIKTQTHAFAYASWNI